MMTIIAYSSSISSLEFNSFIQFPAYPVVYQYKDAKRQASSCSYINKLCTRSIKSTVKNEYKTLHRSTVSQIDPTVTLNPPPDTVDGNPEPDLSDTRQRAAESKHVPVLT